VQNGTHKDYRPLEFYGAGERGSPSSRKKGDGAGQGFSLRIGDPQVGRGRQAKVGTVHF